MTATENTNATRTATTARTMTVTETRTRTANAKSNVIRLTSKGRLLDPVSGTVHSRSKYCDN